MVLSYLQRSHDVFVHIIPSDRFPSRVVFDETIIICGHDWDIQLLQRIQDLPVFNLKTSNCIRQKLSMCEGSKKKAGVVEVGGGGESDTVCCRERAN